MSLRDDASLILIPSAIKDGEVLVQKPLPNKFSDETGNYDGNDPQGSANLTFTRNSNATRVDADGLVEKVRTNSLLQSNQFDTTWINQLGAGTITSGFAGYDGTNNAWQITKDTSTFRSVRQAISITGIFTFSVYVKAGTLSDAALRIDTTAGAVQVKYNLTNGVATLAGGIAISYASTDVGSGWYRLFLTVNATITNVHIYVDRDGTTAGSIFIQDAQLEQGLVATSYIETTTTAMSEFAGVTASSVADVPRLDYSGGSCPSLLLEPQRTNGLPYSEYFDLYSKNAILSITTNATTSPEGVVNASKLIPNTTNAEHIIYRSGMGGGATANTQSIYAKAGGYNFLFIRFDLPTSRAWFNLSNGTVGTLSAGVTATIQDAGNGWYRCSATLTTTSYGNAVIGLAQTDGVQNFAGNGTDGIYIYGWQSEAGASYPTSLIPSYGTTVTRLADSTYVQNLITNGVTTSGGAYTIFFDLSNEPVLNVADGNSEFITLYSGQNLSTATISPRKYYNEADGKIRFYSNVDASNIGYVTSTNKKYAMSVNNNVVKLYSDGALQLTYTGTGNHNTLGSYRLAYGASNRTQAQFSQYIVFDSVLSDTECENLTA